MKMVPVRRITLIAWVALFPIGAAYAHHSPTASYNNNIIKLTGVVVKYNLRSPHSEIVMEVKNAKGIAERWSVESNAVGQMKRMGLDQNKLKPGDIVTVVAWMNREPKRRSVFLTEITTADGTVVGGTVAQLLAAAQVRRGPLSKPESRARAVGIKKMAGRWQQAHFENPDVVSSEPALLLTRAGQKMAEDKNYDPRLAPNVGCTPAALPWLLHLPYLHDLRVSDQEVIIHHELYDIRRTVPLNAKPKKADPAGLFGLVSGRVDGDDLIVDSSHYAPSRWGLARAGTPFKGDVPSSAQKEMTEQYSVSDDGNTLTIAYTVSDPVYLAKPYSNTVTLSRVPDDTPMEFECDLESATRFLR